MKFVNAAIVYLLCASIAIAGPPVVTSMQLTDKMCCWYFNPDGSCVQLSIGMVGVHAGDMNAASLPFDSPYGERVRGGSDPSRVANYCNKRGIQAWNVTGKETKKWAQFAVDTGRYAAIGFGEQHFQTLYGQEKIVNADGTVTVTWLIRNNQTPNRIDRYTDAEFDRQHHASGEWIVVLKQPSSPAPVYIEWE